MLFKIYKKLVFISSLLWCLSSSAQECCGDDCECGKSDISPAGIMNDHTHEKGKWMFSYRYMHMNMSGNIIGDKNITDNDVYAIYNYSMSPSTMTMDMHMLMAMYGVSDRFTIMAMASYNTSSMNMNMFSSGSSMNMPGMSSDVAMPNKQSISGFGDTKVYGLFSLAKNDELQIVVNVGINIPTGSINAIAFPGINNSLRADYIMQPGTGTIDFMPGISLLKHNSNFDWGAQLNGTLRPFYNANGYHYCNEAIAEIWISKKWNNWLSNSVRLETIANGGIAGTDASLITLMEPSADAANYGGSKAYLFPGINFYPGTFLSSDIKLRFEYGFPVYQYAFGIQMKNQETLIANLDFVF